MAKRLPDQITIRENAVIAGIGKSNLFDLEKRHLLPNDKGVKAAKRAAAIAAVMKAGISLIVSAKIVEALLDEFNQNDGEIPSQISDLASKLPRDARAEASKGDNELYWHSVLVRFDDVYKRDRAIGGDAIVDIVDRELVYIRAAPHYRKLDNGTEQEHRIKTMCPWTHEAREAAFVGWLHGAERGGDVSIEPCYKRFSADPENPTFQLGVSEVEHAEQRRRNASATVSINLSLGIRNGFDRLADYRAEEVQKRKARRQNTVARKRSKAVAS